MSKNEMITMIETMNNYDDLVFLKSNRRRCAAHCGAVGDRLVIIGVFDWFCYEPDGPGSAVCKTVSGVENGSVLAVNSAVNVFNSKNVAYCGVINSVAVAANGVFTCEYRNRKCKSKNQNERDRENLFHSLSFLQLQIF